MELEIKLVALPGEDLDPERVLGTAARVLGAAEQPRSRRFEARYHVHESLQAARWSLRARLEGDTWMATLKGPGVEQDGVVGRVEVEVAVPEPAVAGDLLPDPLAHALDAAGAPMTTWPPEAWRAVFDRTTALVPLGDGQFELAVDRGEIKAPWRSGPLCEVELELKSGTVPALRAAAMTLGAELAVRPDGWSKTARGMALSGRLGAPRRPQPEDSTLSWWRHLVDLEERIRAGARHLNGAWWETRYVLVGWLELRLPDPPEDVGVWLQSAGHAAEAWTMWRGLAG